LLGKVPFVICDSVVDTIANQKALYDGETNMGSKFEEMEKFLHNAKKLILEGTLIALLFCESMQFISWASTENLSFLHNLVHAIFSYLTTINNIPFAVIVLAIIILGAILFDIIALNMIIITLFLTDKNQK
jgi:hypothetical protein